MDHPELATDPCFATPLARRRDYALVRLLAPWVRFAESPSAITAPSPLMGQHTREILRDALEMGEHDSAALERHKVVSSVDPRDL